MQMLAVEIYKREIKKQVSINIMFCLKIKYAKNINKKKISNNSNNN